jgi:hypothetical protein
MEKTKGGRKLKGAQNYQQEVQTNGEIQMQVEQHHQQPILVMKLTHMRVGSVMDDSLDPPIALRKEPRARAGKPRERYSFEHDITNYMSAI